MLNINYSKLLEIVLGIILPKNVILISNIQKYKIVKTAQRCTFYYESDIRIIMWHSYYKIINVHLKEILSTIIV